MILALLTAVFQFSQIDKLIEITAGDNKCDQSYFHVGFATKIESDSVYPKHKFSKKKLILRAQEQVTQN